MNDGRTMGKGAGHNAAAAYLAGLRSDLSVYHMGRKLDKAARMLGGDGWRTFPWGDLTAEAVGALVCELAARHAPAYVNTILAAIRGVVEQAHERGEIDSETYRRIRKVRPVAGGPSSPHGRYVPQGERNALMAECLADPTAAGRRDAAMLACGYPGGLRRAEIAGLCRGDLVDDGETVTLSVRGKGRKERQVYLSNGGADALRDWLSVRGDAPGPLFWACTRGGHVVPGRAVSGRAVYDMLRRRAESAGVRPLGAHDLRRSTASDLLDITDAVTVAGQLGHASTDTTARYDRRGERARRRAAEALHIAYSRRTLGAGRLEGRP